MLNHKTLRRLQPYFDARLHGRRVKTIYFGLIFAMLLIGCAAPASTVEESPTVTQTAPESQPSPEPLPSETPTITPEPTPDYKIGVAGEYDNFQELLIESEQAKSQRKQLLDWMNNYWIKFSPRPFAEDTQDLNFIYVFDNATSPKEVGVLVQAGGEYQGRTFYLPIGDDGKYMMTPPALPADLENIPVGFGPLEVSAGTEGLTLAFREGNWVRVNDKGIVVQRIDLATKQWVDVLPPLVEGQEYLAVLPGVEIVANTEAKLQEGDIAVDFSAAVTEARGITSIDAQPGSLEATYEEILRYTYTKLGLTLGQVVKIFGVNYDRSLGGQVDYGEIEGVVGKSHVVVVTETEYARIQTGLDQSGTKYTQRTSDITISGAPPSILAWFDNQGILNVAVIPNKRSTTETPGKEAEWVIKNGLVELAVFLEYGLGRWTGGDLGSVRNYDYVYNSITDSLDIH